MSKKKSFVNILIYGFYFFTGFFIAVILIWPGIINPDKRKCFLKIIKDGIDGKVSLGTILSIEPKNLLKIRNAKTKYSKILLIGDQCFRE